MTNISAAMERQVSSADDLLAIAHAMEMEAARRYRDLAARMRLRGEAALADLFEFLSGIEEKHAHQIDDRAIAITGHAPASIPVGWDLPENFDEEEGSSRLLTPYLALAIAVRNEERTFAFYCYVAAGAANGRLRALAEELAKDELNHATLLRRERRKAYRTEGRAGRPAQRSTSPASMHEFMTRAAELELSAARHHRELASVLADSDRPAARAFADAAADEIEAAATLGRTDTPGPTDDGPRTGLTAQDGLRLLEEAFAYYSDVAERSQDEEIVHRAQILAERAVRRLALTSGSLAHSPIIHGPAAAAGNHAAVPGVSRAGHQEF